MVPTYQAEKAICIELDLGSKSQNREVFSDGNALPVASARSVCASVDTLSWSLLSSTIIEGRCDMLRLMGSGSGGRP